MTNPERLVRPQGLVTETFPTDFTASELHDLQVDFALSEQRRELYAYAVNLIRRVTVAGADDIEKRLPITAPDLFPPQPVTVEHDIFKKIDLVFEPLGFRRGALYGEVTAPEPLIGPLQTIVNRYLESFDREDGAPIIDDMTILGLARECEDYTTVGTLQEDMGGSVELRSGTVPSVKLRRRDRRQQEIDKIVDYLVFFQAPS